MVNPSQTAQEGVKIAFLLNHDTARCLAIEGDIEFLTGYSAHDILASKPAFRSLIHPDDLDVADQLFAAEQYAGPRQQTYRIIRRDGRAIILHCDHRKEADPSGNGTQLLLSLFRPARTEPDIVRRHALTNIVAMLDNTDDYIYFKDRDHVFTGASQTLVSITDLTEHWTDLIGKTDYEVFSREFADIYFTLEKKVFSGQVAVAQEVQPTLDRQGNPGWVDNRKYPIKDKDGHIVGLFGVARDITELKRTQDALQKEQAFIKGLLDSLPGIFFLYSYPELRLEMWNRQHEELLGFRPEEMKERHLTDWFLPEHRQIVLAAVETVMLEGQNRLEGDMVSKDGELLPLLFSGIRVDNQGRRYLLGIGIDITKRRVVETKLQASHDLLAKLSRNVAGVIYQFRLSPDGRFSLPYASDTLKQYFGVTPGEVCEDAGPLLANLHPDDRDGIMASIQTSAETMRPWQNEFRASPSIGITRWLTGVANPERQPDGGILWHGFITDITERKQTELRQQMAASVFTHAHEGIVITDANGVIIDINDTFTRITGYARDEAVGQKTSILRSNRQGPEFYDAMWQSLLAEGTWSGEIWNRRKDGEVYAVLLTISAVCDDHGKTQSYVALLTDISQMKQHEQQLTRMAHYDALTDMPNRVLFMDRLQQAIAQSQRRKLSLAVAYIDLDGFKAVNDQHGHDVGDELLIAISGRMRASLREADTLARIGGDEFAAVLTDFRSPPEYEPVLARLLHAIAEPISIGGANLQLSASIGVAFFPHDGKDPDTLLRRADHAMYQAKQAGKNCYRLFTGAASDRQ